MPAPAAAGGRDFHSPRRATAMVYRRSVQSPKILPYCLLYGKTRKNTEKSEIFTFCGRFRPGFGPVSACAGRFFHLKPHILLQNHPLSAFVCAALCFSGGILQYPHRFHRKYRKNQIYPTCQNVRKRNFRFLKYVVLFRGPVCCGPRLPLRPAARQRPKAAAGAGLRGAGSRLRAG